MSTQWDQQYRERQGRYFPAEELVRFLGRAYGSVVEENARGLTAVDLGCGVGGNVRALAEWGFFTHGLESSVEALRLAKNYAEKKGYAQFVHYAHYRAPECMGLPAGSVNLVIDVQTMQHLNDAEHIALYQEVWRVLAPGGTVFQIHWVGDPADAKIIFPAHPELEAWHSGWQVIDLLMQAGFMIPYHECVIKTYGMHQGALAKGTWAVYEAVKS